MHEIDLAVLVIINSKLGDTAGHELRDAHRQRREPAARVEHGGVALVRLVQDRRRRGERDVGRHLEGDRLHVAADDLGGDRVPRDPRRTREDAEMGVTASRAPFVENRALEFNQVVPDDADPRAIDAVPRNVPPAPCTSEMERQLRDQLSAKENEIRRLNDRFARLESMIDRIADSQTREVAVRQPQPKRIVGASYVQDEAETVEQSPQPVLSTRFNRSAAPKASAPVKKPTVDSAESAPRNVGFSYLASEEPVADGLGVWKGEGKQPSSSKDGSGKRTSR